MLFASSPLQVFNLLCSLDETYFTLRNLRISQSLFKSLESENPLAIFDNDLKSSPGVEPRAKLGEHSSSASDPIRTESKGSSQNKKGKLNTPRQPSVADDGSDGNNGKGVSFSTKLATSMYLGGFRATKHYTH